MKMNVDFFCPGKEIAIGELALLIRNIAGYKGDIVYNSMKPDGAPRKLCDGSKLRNLGWSAKYSLKEGIEKIYLLYLNLKKLGQ